MVSDQHQEYQTGAPMSAAEANDEQGRLWNGDAGHAWVDAQPALDSMFKPIEQLLIEAVTARAPRTLLDVGCGTGATTLAAARSLGAPGACTGIDISAPMIAVARARAEQESLPVHFTVADAETHAFAPARFDAIMSRFGVMFFGDPVRAFTNLRRAARNDAELRFVAWRSADENPFMTTAERAAAPLLPNLPARKAGGPGQFAFADDREVRKILTSAGWSAIDCRQLDVACALPEQDLMMYLTRLGPVGRALDEVSSEDARRRIGETVRRAFDSYVQRDEVHFNAACWMVAAAAR
jgi:ubiquinone/menaquinone biosynthesis C-methylase UbiE